MPVAPGPGVELEVAAVAPVGDSLGALVQAEISIAVASIGPTLAAVWPRSTRLPSRIGRERDS